MIVHIVMIKFKDEYKQKAHDIKVSLEDLVNKIQELKSMEVGINIIDSERGMDLVLTAIFDDIEGLETYRVHPAHQNILKDIKKNFNTIFLWRINCYQLGYMDICRCYQ